MLYSFNDADAPERHETQYFEMFCNRGIYHKGWSAVTKHRTPWVMGGAVMPAFDDDVWELYDGNSDWTQANDLSKENPGEAARAAASLADRSGQVQRAAARRPPDRTHQPDARRPADADQRQHPVALRGHGAAVGEQRRQHQEQVVRRHRRGDVPAAAPKA